MSNVTMSFGVAYSNNYLEGEDLLPIADCLLYGAKKKEKTKRYLILVSYTVTHTLLTQYPHLFSLKV